MKNRAAYTVLFVLFLTVLCTILLTAANQMLRPKIVRNRTLAHKKSVLFASGLIDLPEQRGLIQSVLQFAGLLEEDVPEIPDDTIEMLYDQFIVETGKGQYAVFYPGGYTGLRLAGTARDFEFTGYKGKIRGVISVDETKKKLLGVGVYDQQETAGKGALVGRTSVLKQFRGVSVEKGYLMIKQVLPRDVTSRASVTFRKMEKRLNIEIALAQGKMPLDIEEIVFDAVGKPTGKWPITQEKPKTLRALDYSRPPYTLPGAFVNLALNKTVKTNVEKEAILHNNLSVVTDGILNSKTGKVGLLNFGATPYVQVDLEKESAIYCIGIWHNFANPVYTDIIVQIADDESFTKNVRTLFNNDYDNSVGLTKLDRQPVDWLFRTTKFGELVPRRDELKPGGFIARYIRVYTDKDLFTDEEARFVEIMAWGMQE